MSQKMKPMSLQNPVNRPVISEGSCSTPGNTEIVVNDFVNDSFLWQQRERERKFINQTMKHNTIYI